MDEKTLVSQLSLYTWSIRFKGERGGMVGGSEQDYNNFNLYLIIEMHRVCGWIASSGKENCAHSVYSVYCRVIGIGEYC